MIELKSGMKVTTENGREYVITRDATNICKLIAVYALTLDNSLQWVGFSGDNINGSPIIKIESSTCVGDPWGHLVWEKKEPPPKLEAGMIVELSEDTGRRIVLEHMGGLYLVRLNSKTGTWLSLSEYDINLIHDSYPDDFTVCCVWKTNLDCGLLQGSKLLWERKC